MAIRRKSLISLRKPIKTRSAQNPQIRHSLITGRLFLIIAIFPASYSIFKNFGNLVNHDFNRNHFDRIFDHQRCIVRDAGGYWNRGSDFIIGTTGIGQRLERRPPDSPSTRLVDRHLAINRGIHRHRDRKSLRYYYAFEVLIHRQ